MWGNLPHTAAKYYLPRRAESIGMGDSQVGHHAAVGSPRGPVTIEGTAVVRGAPARAGPCQDPQLPGFPGQVLPEIEVPGTRPIGGEATPEHHLSPYFIARATDTHAAMH